MALTSLSKPVARYIPRPLLSLAKGMYLRWRHPAHSSLKGVGTVQDLYYWLSDDSADTLLLLQNYFSVFYPDLDTHTSGTVSLFNHTGGFLGREDFDLAAFSCAKFTVSSLLDRFGLADEPAFGTLECHLYLPPGLKEVTEISYFFDRFYIGYLSRLGQPTFVHGVDKTNIYREDKPSSSAWYAPKYGHQWAPEIPVNLEDYQRLWVVLINRTSKSSTTTLTVSDSNNRSKTWEASIQPGGVHRFELTMSNIIGLLPNELAMRIDGMPTKRGRPIIFKEFYNGAISVMHC